MKPRAPMFSSLTATPGGTTVRRASVAAFKVTVRDTTGARIPPAEVAVTVTQKGLRPLVEIQRLPALRPGETVTLRFRGFPHREFTK